MKQVLIITILLALSGCASQSLGERQASGKLHKNLEELQGIAYVTSDDVHIKYAIDIKSIKVDFAGNERYHDTSLHIKGYFSSLNNGYLINTPIEIKAVAASVLNGNTLNFEDLLIENIEFRELYSELSSSLKEPLNKSLLIELNERIKRIPLLLNKQSDISVKKHNDGKRIKFTSQHQ